MVKITATIEDVIFRNAESGYSVVGLDYNGTLLTAVGVFPSVAEGLGVELEGDFVENSRYGRQFSVSSVKLVEPSKKEAIARYLASGLFKGVGEVTASNIVETFSDDALNVIENQPQKLTAVKGISSKKAQEISSCYIKFKAMQQAVMFLQSYGISLNYAIKIFRCYEQATVSIVSKNPYRLTEDVDGIGFITADRIARSFGIEKNSEYRIKAAVIFILSESASKSGNTFLPWTLLLKEVIKLLEFTEGEDIEKTNDCIKEMTVLGELSVFDRENYKAVMLPKFYKTELSISEKLISLHRNSGSVHIDIEREIQDFEKETGYKLHEGQKNAVKTSVNSGVSVITGGPGTGKTTILKCVISVFENNNLKVALCAPTGRAAKRLSDATGRNAKTIHRLLDADYKSGKGKFTYDEYNKLDADAVIIDEISMADEYIFNALLKAVKSGARFILVGDKDQLPSVGAGSVLSDIIKSEVIPVSSLTFIYRQDGNSLIAENAHLINKGKMPIIDNKSKDFFMSQSSDLNEMLNTVIELCKKRIPKFINVAPMEIQVLSPMKKGICGVENLNIRLQESLNPPSPDKKEIKFYEYTFRTGDKVIQVVNNYQLDWKKDTGKTIELGSGIYNGDIGIVKDADKKEGTLTVLFEDGREAVYTAGDLDQITLAYAITVHKSQGCEFDVCLLVVTSGNYMILTKNLLYTAVTRAKKMAVLVGDKINLEKMVKNRYTQKRYSCLADFIKAEDEKQC